MPNPLLIYLWLQKNDDVFLNYKLDHSSKRLLENIIIENKFGNTLTVTKAMGLKSVGAPATVHRKIEELLHLNLILFEFRDGNMRTKFLVPSKVATDIYEKLGKLFEEAMLCSKTW